MDVLYIIVKFMDVLYIIFLYIICYVILYVIDVFYILWDIKKNRGINLGFFSPDKNSNQENHIKSF